MNPVYLHKLALKYLGYQKHFLYLSIGFLIATIIFTLGSIGSLNGFLLSTLLLMLFTETLLIYIFLRTFSALPIKFTKDPQQYSSESVSFVNEPTWIKLYRVWEWFLTIFFTIFLLLPLLVLGIVYLTRLNPEIF